MQKLICKLKHYKTTRNEKGILLCCDPGKQHIISSTYVLVICLFLQVIMQWTLLYK